MSAISFPNSFISLRGRRLRGGAGFVFAVVEAVLMPSVYVHHSHAQRETLPNPPLRLKPVRRRSPLFPIVVLSVVMRRHFAKDLAALQQPSLRRPDTKFVPGDAPVSGPPVHLQADWRRSQVQRTPDPEPEEFTVPLVNPRQRWLWVAQDGLRVVGPSAVLFHCNFSI